MSKFFCTTSLGLVQDGFDRHIGAVHTLSSGVDTLGQTRSLGSANNWTGDSRVRSTNATSVPYLPPFEIQKKPVHLFTNLKGSLAWISCTVGPMAIESKSTATKNWLLRGKRCNRLLYLFLLLLLFTSKWNSGDKILKFSVPREIKFSPNFF